MKRGESHLGFLELIDGTGENIIAYGELLTYFRIKFAPVVEILESGEGESFISEILICVRQIAGLKISACLSVRDTGV